MNSAPFDAVHPSLQRAQHDAPVSGVFHTYQDPKSQDALIKDVRAMQPGDLLNCIATGYSCASIGSSEQAKFEDYLPTCCNMGKISTH